LFFNLCILFALLTTRSARNTMHSTKRYTQMQDSFIDNTLEASATRVTDVNSASMSPCASMSPAFWRLMHRGAVIESDSNDSFDCDGQKSISPDAWRLAHPAGLETSANETTVDADTKMFACGVVDDQSVSPCSGQDMDGAGVGLASISPATWRQIHCRSTSQATLDANTQMYASGVSHEQSISPCTWQGLYGAGVGLASMSPTTWRRIHYRSTSGKDREGLIEKSLVEFQQLDEPPNRQCAGSRDGAPDLLTL